MILRIFSWIKICQKNFEKHFFFICIVNHLEKEQSQEGIFCLSFFAFVLEMHASLYNKHEIFFNSFFKSLVLFFGVDVARIIGNLYKILIGVKERNMFIVVWVIWQLLLLYLIAI